MRTPVTIPERFHGSIGVFAGCSANTYLLHNLASHPGFLAEYLSFQQMGAHPSMLGNDKDFFATRIAYKLNLRGPSITVQCGLLDLARRDLPGLPEPAHLPVRHRAGRRSFRHLSAKARLCRRGGQPCFPDGTLPALDASAAERFSAMASGWSLLKRVDEAIRDGDYIHAIIRGFGVNNDGSTKVSYMAPSVEGQAEAIATAQALAGIDAEHHRLRRGARHGHVAGRSDRGRRADQSFSRGHGARSSSARSARSKATSAISKPRPASPR